VVPHSGESVPLEAGSMLSGKYRIISLIGVGGVGRVYLARHVELDTEVAIKMLRPEMVDRPDAVQRFAREARASVRLHSERIARVLDVGSHEGRPYFVMEYLVGSNLMDVRLQGDIDTATFCEFFIQACEGLAAAHAMGVVHRDIKPENLFVVRDSNGWRSLKLLDFGISKFSLTGKHSDVDLASMRTEAMMGTPHYISPEQIRSTKDVDHRTDIWSLGAVMFEVLSGGILPFREEREFTALIAEVLERPHRSLLDVAPNVPERLGAIIDRCLMKDRDQRYQTTAEVALDLLPLAPLRARASAERAVSAMQAAGLMAVNGDFDSLRPRAITRSDWPSVAPSSNAPPVVPVSMGSLVPPAPALVPLAAPVSSAPLSSETVRPHSLPPPRPASPSAASPVSPERVLSTPPTTLTGRTPASPMPAVEVQASQVAQPLSVPPRPSLASLAHIENVGSDQAKQRRRNVLLVLLLLCGLLVTAVALALRGEGAERSSAPQAPKPAVTQAASVADWAEATPPVAPSTSSALGTATDPLSPSATGNARKPSKVWVAPRPPAPAPIPVSVPPSKAPEPSPASAGKLELKRER
jgi:eukaryotic-like serine/threonine-protein kinase